MQQITHSSLLQLARLVYAPSLSVFADPFFNHLFTDTQRFVIASSSQFLRVAVPTPLRRVFDYLPVVGADAPVAGTRIRVPFGRRQVIGILLEVADSSSWPEKQLKTAL